MIFIDELATDPYTWEILGTREVTFRQDPTDLWVEFFCICHQNYASSNNRVKAFKLPISYLRLIKPGSLWCDGYETSPKSRVKMTRSLNGETAKLVVSRTKLSTEKIIKSLARSNNPHFSFLKHTNYLIFKNPGQLLYVHCSEIIRHFMTPSPRFFNLVMSGKIATHLSKYQSEGIHCIGHGIMRKNELMATQALANSPHGRRAALLPYKSIKLTHIKNNIYRTNHPALLTTTYPSTEKHTAFIAIFIMPDYLKGTTSRTIAVQLHKSTETFSPASPFAI